VPLVSFPTGPGLETDFLERAIVLNVEGTDVPVMSPEDVVVTKILTGRPKDIEDARSVMMARRHTLDTDRIRALLGMLEQALTQSDLLPAFEKEWDWATKSARPTTPRLPRA